MQKKEKQPKGATKRIAVLSYAQDVHALAVLAGLNGLPGVEGHLIASDQVSGNSVLSWSTAGDAVLPTAAGAVVQVSDIDVLWWRRVPPKQILPDSLSKDPVNIDIINRDCAAALFGILRTEFRGTWLNDVRATQHAGNKLVQLDAAQQSGLRVPKTLVTQDPEHVARFWRDCAGKIIAKPIAGTRKTAVLTERLSSDILQNHAGIRACPAIYQEYIEGTKHLRVQVFGDSIYAAQIESQDVDWRMNLDVPMSAVDIPRDLAKRLRSTLDALGLRMGIVDLKLDDAAQPVWLEVNPQGQFLFIEGLTDLKLTEAFVEFLLAEATDKRRASA